MMRYIFFVLILTAGNIDISSNCALVLQSYDRCIQIFVEKDLPVLEEFIKWNVKFKENGRQGRPIVIDGPELDTNCRQIEKLLSCMKNATTEYCSVLPHKQAFSLIIGLHHFVKSLCKDPGIGIKVLLNDYHCMDEVRRRECKYNELDPFPWRSILRMEVQKNKICPVIRKQRDCMMKSSLNKSCGLDSYNFVDSVTFQLSSTWCNSCQSFATTNQFLVTFLIMMVICCDILFNLYT